MRRGVEFGSGEFGGGVWGLQHVLRGSVILVRGSVMGFAYFPLSE